MTTSISAEGISEAWSLALDHLVEAGGKDVHVAVTYQSPEETPEVRAALDGLLDERRQGERPYPVRTVANTIFPMSLYHPHLGDEAAPRLYENYARSMRAHRRRSRDKETYFNRLMAYPGGGDGDFNQLEFVVGQIRSQLGKSRGGPLSSAYELGASHPTLDAELRIQMPGEDRRIMHFPCLSHISITLKNEALNLAAIYRNQMFIERAYGNYLGLSRLLDFLANETGCRVGEVLCVATHADAEFHGVGKRAVTALAQECRDILGHAQVSP